ncbi:MAG TPA: hypothetical protein VNO26_03885 [Candidatus Limnocylindria bacterium]|nr:hypothetical protein [Candidatus Limnocylindria bacterium]
MMRIAPHLVLAVLWLGGPAHGATSLGPSPYLDRTNSPLDTLAPDFVLEDFEDGLLNVAGVTPSAGAVLAPGPDTDSVDADDGAIDGFGRDGHSWSAADGAAGITFTLDPTVLGGFPREAGVVWTDGQGPVTFEAFDAFGASLGVIGPVTAGDGATDGATPEDRFFGVRHDGGVSAIRITGGAGAIEVDHLQLGGFNRPPDCSGAYATPSIFWPPNHRFASVHVRGVTDPDGDPVVITITGLGQDEPVDAAGSGSTCPDGAGVGTSTAQIRVERAGPGDGRVYAIDFRAEDGRGGACDGVVTVCVPHDQGHGVCGDQGPLADSTGLACVTDCDGADCHPSECAGERVPRGVTRRLGNAGRLLDRAAGRGSVRPARKAVKLLAAAERKLARAETHDKLADDCAQAVAARVHMAAERARRWLETR